MHRHLVGGVQDAGRGAAGHGRVAGQAQAGEGVRVRRLEAERAQLHEVEMGHGHVGALGMVERVGDRNAHVGIPEVRERRSVVQVDHGVHD